MSRFSRLAIAAALLASGCSGPSLEVLDRHTNDFLTRQGTELRLRGQRYRFVSFNAFTLTGCGNPDEIPDDAKLDAFFASLRPRSLVRTYAYEVIPMSGIERVVAAAKARGQYLILVLASPTKDCGAAATKTLDWYQSGFRDTYLPWVQQVVTRFKDEPAVGMWEPINTPLGKPPFTEGVDRLTLRTFYDVVGGEIHRIDSNHLIESGTHGPWAYQDTPDAYAYVHASSGIDVASFRDYDTTHGEPPNLAPSLAAMDSVGKPVILGEAGMFASASGDAGQVLNEMPCISWSVRSDRFKAWLEAGFSTPLAGVDVWNWLPVDHTSRSTCEYTIGLTDPLVQVLHDFPIP